MDDPVLQALVELKAQVEALTHVVGLLLAWDAAREEDPEFRISIALGCLQSVFEAQDISDPAGQQLANGIRRVAEVLEQVIAKTEKTPRRS